MMALRPRACRRFLTRRLLAVAEGALLRSQRMPVGVTHVPVGAPRSLIGMAWRQCHALAEAGKGIEQRRRVRVLRSRQDAAGGPRLHHGSAMHHVDAAADLLD